jgi:hypothetical protein
VRAGNAPQDPLNIRSKPDIEHAVGFVEHDMKDVTQDEGLSHDVVDHAPRRPDHNIHALFKRSKLALDRLTAVNPRDPGGMAEGEFSGLPDDLLDELASGREHEGLRDVTAFEHLEDREEERGRLAGSGLGLCQYIQPIEGTRDDVGLNRCGLEISCLA